MDEINKELEEDKKIIEEQMEQTAGSLEEEIELLQNREIILE